MAPSFSGVVLLDKAEGTSSFGALGSLKKHYNTRRVGHTGTLDPMATGLIAALVGPATRCARYFSSLDKTYEATITFGTQTDTDDRTGAPVRTAALPDMNEARAALGQFLGRIRQTPPAYSAIHVDGRRAYDRARSGEDVQVPSREVTINGIEAVGCEDADLRIVVRCSSGTYIRSLARDLGLAMGSAAHLSALRRTQVGPFLVHECEASSIGRHREMSVSEALLRLPGFTAARVDSGLAARMWNGGSVPETELVPLLEGRTRPADGGEQRILAMRGETPVAIGMFHANRFVYDLVFPRSVANV